jgi:hypothetical protein
MILVIVAMAFAQPNSDYDLDWSTIDGGSGTVSGGGYVLGSTVGQVDSGQLRAGSYALTTGFWSGVDSPGLPSGWSRSFLPYTIKP